MSHFRERRGYYRQISNEDRQKFMQHHKRKRIAIGIFLVLAGTAFLLKTAAFPFPAWLFTWPMIPLGLGLLIGITTRFRNGGWIFPTLIGAAFLVEKIYPGMFLRQYIWPIAIILIGLVFIFKPKRRHHFHPVDGGGSDITSGSSGVFSDESATVTSEDFIESTTIFGGVKKTNISKNFKGGTITNTFGGAEINLLQTDFTGIATIDISEIFGGVKLIIPAHWQVRNDASAIFGGISDSRDFTNVTLDPNKLLIIKGSVVFGGVDITNF